MRKYKRKLGARSYKNYEDSTLDNALLEVVEGRMTLREASRSFKVPYGTLNNRYNGRHGSKPGGRQIFTSEEERAFVNNIMKCSDWGFPLTERDLKLYIKSYLDARGVVEQKFTNNIPGDDWVKLFLKRHNTILGERWAANIKKSRAAVTKTTIEEYFNNLQATVEGVDPSCIFNYDESNVSDDPGKVKAIFRKGVKYPERVINHSKSATSLMMCGSASGVLLPPYIIYKGEHLWDTWKQGGPKGSPCCSEPCCRSGARYSRTKHGWIDSETFDDWFQSCFLPHARRLPGKKVLLGDNLSSHLNANVIKKCEEHNIAFTCLPPNSTHILQPLDVAFFRPFKTAWRATLSQWKMSNPRNNTVTKDCFPSLLKSAIDKMNTAIGKDKTATDNGIKRNLRSGFECTGIYPFNPTRVLKKIPGGIEETEVNDFVNDSLTEFLKKQRGVGQTTWNPRQKKKKLRVDPGKSITAASSSESSEAEGVDGQSEENERSEDEARNIPMEADDEVQEYIEANDETIVVGSYALIKFTGTGKRNASIFKYVCLIEKKLSDNEIEVKGLKSVINKNDDVQRFRIIDNDISVVPRSDILFILPNPKKEGTENRPEYRFPMTVDVKEW